MMPFAIPFLDLCYEIAKRCRFDKRVLLDKEGNVIMDFSPNGIEVAFGWKRYEDDYTLANSEEFHDSTAQPKDYIRTWLYEDYQSIQGQRLISTRREEFLPIVAKLITLLSRVTGQENDSKYRKEFIGFIAVISSGGAIRWSRVINDVLRHQLAYFGSSKRFYMKSYLVYLLLHGKIRSRELANEKHLGKKGIPVWRVYLKWWYHNKFQHFYERTDQWEYSIYKDIKGESMVKRISDVAIQAINVHENFYL